MSSRLSVCLPTFNRARYLKDTIESILAQSITDFELIVADNCSTDNTSEVVAAVHDPRVRYVKHAVNIGHYRNMNYCLDVANGEYVCIVHDDDVYLPTFLAEESAVLDRYPRVGIVHCAHVIVDPDRRPLRLQRLHRRDRVADGLTEYRRFLGGHDIACSTVMFRRDLARKAGPFVPEIMCADFLMWLNLALLGDVAYVARPLVEVRMHGGSMTSTMDPHRWCDEFLEVADRSIGGLRDTRPALWKSRETFMRPGIRQQAKRFLVAGLASAAAGESDLASRYLEVLRTLEPRGGPRAYALVLGLFLTPIGRHVLLPVREARRAFAKARAHRSLKNAV